MFLMQGQVAEAVADLELLVRDQHRVLGPAHPETVRHRTLLEDSRRILARLNVSEE
ncbi:hypothetical protein ACFQ0T_03005 [Kitasatospora gansuensis]